MSILLVALGVAFLLVWAVSRYASARPKQTAKWRKAWLRLQPGLLAVAAVVGFALFVCCGKPILK